MGDFADHLSFLSDAGHSQNLAWFVGRNTVRYAAGVFVPEASEEQLQRMEGYVDEAMEAGALGLSTGLEFNPGRSAPTAELSRLNRVVGRHGGYYTSHVRNRDAHLQDSIDEFLTIVREGGTRGQISHLNVRHRTGAAPGAWQRAVDTMARAREVEGLDVLADTTPFRDGLGQMAGILPPWVLDDGWQEACKQLRDPVKERLGRLRPVLALHPQGRLAPRPAPGEPSVPRARGRLFDEAVGQMGLPDLWDAYFEVLPRRPGIESLLLSASSFTDEHLAEMIPASAVLSVSRLHGPLDAGLDAVVGHPVCFAGHVHYLTHHVGEAERCRSRRRSTR